jgi:hypothetical protein
MGVDAPMSQRAGRDGVLFLDDNRKPEPIADQFGRGAAVADANPGLARPRERDAISIKALEMKIEGFDRELPVIMVVGAAFDEQVLTVAHPSHPIEITHEARH